jgi:hypothetical protein
MWLIDFNISETLLTCSWMIFGASGFKKKSMYAYGSNPRSGANTSLRRSTGKGSPFGGRNGMPTLQITAKSTFSWEKYRANYKNDSYNINAELASGYRRTKRDAGAEP